MQFRLESNPEKSPLRTGARVAIGSWNECFSQKFDWLFDLMARQSDAVSRRTSVRSSSEAQIILVLDQFFALTAAEIARRARFSHEQIASTLAFLTQAGLVLTQSHHSGSPESAFSLSENGQIVADKISEMMQVA